MNESVILKRKVGVRALLFRSKGHDTPLCRHNDIDLC